MRYMSVGRVSAPMGGRGGSSSARPASSATSAASATSASSAASEPETLTEELLDQLLKSATPDAYLDELPKYDRTLAQYLDSLLDEHGLKKSQVIRSCGINATFGYQIFQGTRKPGRDHALMLAFGLRCSLRETQRLLRLAGVSELWCKNRRDAIIIYCISHGMSLQQCDDELYRLHEDTLTHEG